MERLPATDPRLLANGGDVRTTADYDVGAFHAEHLRAYHPSYAYTPPSLSAPAVS